MKHLLLWMLLVTPLCGFDDAKFLQAVLEVETAGEFWRIGENGERSAYQITAEVWYTYTDVPFVYASYKDYEDSTYFVALSHLRWIKKTLGDELTVETAAQVWNGGLGAYRRKQLKPRTIDYARRVRNIYEQL